MTRYGSISPAAALFLGISLAGCEAGSGVAGIDGTGVRQPIEALAYGRVTGFGSVVVNGVRYDTSNATFLIDGTPGRQSDLDINGVVRVSGKVNDVSATEGIADTVEFDHIVIGPIESIEDEAHTFTALGQTIRIHEATTFDERVPFQSMSGLAVGSIVKVSGYRNHEDIITATRIGTSIPGVESFRTTGAVSNVDRDAGRLQINDLSVDYLSAISLNGTGINDIQNGNVVTVVGSRLGTTGELVADHVEPEWPAAVSSGTEVDVEGLITRLDRDDLSRFEVAGLPVRVNEATTVIGEIGLDRVIAVEGRVDAGSTVVASTLSTPAQQGTPAPSATPAPVLFYPMWPDLRYPPIDISGVYTVDVYVYDAHHGPISGARMNAVIQRPNRHVYNASVTQGPLITNGDGRLRITNVPAGALMTFHAFHDAFVQPCAVLPEVTNDRGVEIEMVARSTLNAFNPPRPITAEVPSLTGRVYERTDAGIRPVEGVVIAAEGGLMLDIATTISDLDGQYFLCNLHAVFAPDQRAYDGVSLWISKPGFESGWYPEAIDIREPTVVDIELKRKQ